MNKEFKKRLYCLIGLFLTLMLFLLGSAKKETDPRDVISGVNIISETDSASLGSYNLRRESFNVISDSSESVRNLLFDNPCVSLRGITNFWQFNNLASQPGYEWVIQSSFFGGKCLKLIRK